MKTFSITDIPFMSGINPGTLEHLDIYDGNQSSGWTSSLENGKNGCEKVTNNHPNSILFTIKIIYCFQQRICQNQSIQVKYLSGSGMISVKTNFMSILIFNSFKDEENFQAFGKFYFQIIPIYINVKH